MRSLEIGSAVLLILTLVGCADVPETRLVAGSVTLDGEPLDDAYIEFDAFNGTTPVSLDIKEGKFSGNVPPGDKTVRFFAMRPPKPDPRLGPTDAQPDAVNILPDRYGYGSTMKLNLGADDVTDLSYDLQTRD